MRKSILLLLLCFPSLYLLAQIENGGFETWENIPLFESPDDWMSTNSEFPGTNAVEKSTDAQDGMYSVHLTTVTVQQDTAFGFVLIGSADDDDFTGIPYSGTIDGIKGHYKCDIQNNDSALVLVVGSYQGTSYEPESFYIHGAQNSWTTFDFSFSQTMQVDSITVGIASSDAMNESAVPGSWIQVDSIALLGSSAPALDNYSFENWTTTSYDKPNGWSTINQLTGGILEPVVQSSNAYQGNYAVELKTLQATDFDGDTISGIIANGDISISDSLTSTGGIPYTLQPDSLMGYYVFDTQTPDTAYGFIRFWNSSGNVEFQYFSLEPTGSSFEQFSIPLSLSASPDSMMVLFMGGRQLESSLILDDISLSGGNVGLQELDILNSIKTYPNPAYNELHYSFFIAQSSDIKTSIYDLQGKAIYESSFENFNPGKYTQQLDIEQLHSGMYIFNLNINGQNYEQKIVIE
jgi:hypothetical protein